MELRLSSLRRFQEMRRARVLLAALALGCVVAPAHAAQIVYTFSGTANIELNRFYDHYVSFPQAHFTITGIGDTMNYSNNCGHSPYDGSPGSCVPVVLSLS